MPEPFAEPQLIRYHTLLLVRARFGCLRGHDALLSMHSNREEIKVHHNSADGKKSNVSSVPQEAVGFGSEVKVAVVC